MAFDGLASRRKDIQDALEHVRQFLTGRSFEDYRTDTMLRFAVERCIEIVSEASRHIPAQMKAQHPSIPWQNVADIGNVLRHGYQSVDPHILWEVATNRLTELRAAVEQMLREIDEDDSAV
jgi:uncharacterized protein with HEPN domain